VGNERARLKIMLSLLPLRLAFLFHRSQLKENVKTTTLQLNASSSDFHLANRCVQVFTPLC